MYVRLIIGHPPVVIDLQVQTLDDRRHLPFELANALFGQRRAQEALALVIHRLAQS
jgi:hypothetical protein